MLIYKLHPNDRATIGPEVMITVLRGRDDAWLVIGIDAPLTMKITRLVPGVSEPTEDSGATTTHERRL